MSLVADLSRALGLGERADASAQSTRQLFAGFLRDSVTAAGISITPQKSLQISAVWSSVCILSEAVGSLPLIVYRRLPNGGKERAVDHPMYRVLRYRPNRRHTAAEFRSLEQADVESYGEAFAKKITINGEVRELLPIEARRVEDVDEKSDGDLMYKIVSRDGTDARWHDGKSIVHLRGPGGDGIRGAPVAEQFRELFALAFGLEMFLSYSLKNGTRTSGVLAPATGSLGDKAWERLKDWLSRDHQGLENTGKLLALPEQMQFTKTSMNFEEAQVADLDARILARIARVYRIPLHMLADAIAQPRANMEQQGREFIDQALRGRLKRWEERYNAEFFDDGSEYFCEFLLDDLLRGDAATRALVYRALAELGILTRNEVREAENRNPLPGLDEPLTPLNMSRGAAGAGAPATPAAPGSAMALLEELLRERAQLHTESRNGHSRS